MTTPEDLFPEVPSGKEPMPAKPLCYAAPSQAIRYKYVKAECRSLPSCSHCGAPRGYPHPITGQHTRLTLHFVDGDRKNLAHENVLWLCQRCLTFARAKKLHRHAPEPPPGDQGRAQRDEAMQRISGHTPDDFLEAAIRHIAHIARETEQFASDELMSRMKEDGWEIHDWRALGPIFKEAEKRGIIVPTERFMPSSIPSQHRSPLRCWVLNPALMGKPN